MNPADTQPGTQPGAQPGTQPGTQPGDGMIARRRLLMLAPLGVAVAGGAAFWVMLSRMRAGRFDPHDIGNPMLGKKMPDFSLPGLDGSGGFSSADVVQAAQTAPVLVNFFMSTCIPCAEEAGTLDTLTKNGVQIWGIAWEDPPEKSKAFLERFGNPFTKVAADRDGSVAINFGIYGVPETFLIDRTGHIAWHMAGGISDEVAAQVILPQVAKAKA